MAPFVDDGGRLVPEHSTRLQSKPLASIPQTHASTLSTAPMHDTLGAPFQPKTFGSRLRSNSAPSRKRVRIRDGSAGSSSGSSASTFNTPELVGGFSRFTNGPISIAMRASPSAPELRIPPWTHRERNASVASSRVAQDDPRSARSRDEYDVDPVEVVAPVSLCEAVVLPHPRLQKQSPKAKHRATSSDASSHKKGKARALSFGEGDDSDVRTVERPRRLFLDDETGEDSSVRRVLRENEESRKEREAWSDSAAHALGSSWRARSATRGRGRRKRSEADEAEVETSTMSNEQRRGDLQRLRQERERQAHLLAATDREDFEPPRTLFKPVTAEYSPPVAHSFDPFADLGRKLSVKRSLRHRGRGRRSSGHATNSDTTGSTGRRGSHDTGAQDRFVDSYPRFVGGQPIRHIRTSPSVDSLSPRLGASIASTSEMGPTQYGEALSSVTPAPASPQPVKYKQNAAVSLPPHLHHLLRSPEAPVTVLPLMDMPQPDEYTPHRPPPSAPTHTRVTSILNEEQNGRRSSSDSIALLALALGTKLELEADEEPMITDTRRPSLEPRAPVIERARLQEDSPRGAAISSVFPGRPSEAPALPTGRSLLPPSPKQQRRSSLTPRRLLPPRVPESALFDLTNGLGISRAGPARSGPSRNLAMFATTGDDPFRPPSPQSRRQSAESRESSSDGDSSELDLDLDEADEAFGGLVSTTMREMDTEADTLVSSSFALHPRRWSLQRARQAPRAFSRLPARLSSPEQPEVESQRRHHSRPATRTARATLKKRTSPPIHDLARPCRSIPTGTPLHSVANISAARCQRLSRRTASRLSILSRERLELSPARPQRTSPSEAASSRWRRKTRLTQRPTLVERWARRPTLSSRNGVRHLRHVQCRAKTNSLRRSRLCHPTPSRPPARAVWSAERGHCSRCKLRTDNELAALCHTFPALTSFLTRRHRHRGNERLSKDSW